jgi:hypothetical protein
MATAATSSFSSTAGTFMFHPRTAVFEQPITYNVPSSSHSTSTISNKPDKNDLSQYYISEQLFHMFLTLFFYE